MVLAVANLWVAVLPLRNFSLVLGMLEVELVLAVDVTAQVFWQVRRRVNLYNEVNALIDQLGRLFGYELEVFATVRRHRDNIDVELAVHLESGADQVDCGRVVNQVGECF